MAKIRTAILGYGRSGSTMHADSIEGNDAFELAAVCDIDPLRQKQASERFGCAIYDDYRKMLSNEKVDLVSVVTRSDQHCEMTCDCLAAGVNVLVTKPWAVNAAEAERMVSSSKTVRGMLIPWLPRKWACDLQRLRELIDGGAIGKVFLVRHVVSSFGTRQDWQTERRFGGGYLLNWGPHVVYAALLVRDGKPASVFGRLRQTINPGDVEDVFLAVVTLADGTIVQAEYTVSTEKPPDWYIQGDRGTIVVRGRNVLIHHAVPPQPADPTNYASMQTTDDEVTEEVLEGNLQGDHHQVYQEVAAAIRGDSVFPVKPEDAFELSRVLDAIRTSSDEDRVVHM